MAHLFTWLLHDILQQSDVQIRLSGAAHAIHGHIVKQWISAHMHTTIWRQGNKQVCCICRQMGASKAVSHSQKTADVSGKCDSACLDSLQKAKVSEIYEQHDVPDCGNFTAYTDGSVHVTFHDRALLYMKKPWEHCDVITPDGHRATVNTATPVGVQQYVAQAVEFADWAFSSPSERAAVLQQAAKVQKEIDKCQRAAALCDWAQGQMVSVPPSLEQISGHRDVTVSEKNFPSLFGLPMPEYTPPAEREQMIQALLAKSSNLLNSLCISI